MSDVLSQIAQNTINRLGSIKAPSVKVDSADLTFSVNPNINLEKVNWKDFHIDQIDISDTEIGIKFEQGFEVPGDLQIGFSIDGKIKDFSKSITENGTKLTFDIAATDINQNIKMSMKMSESLMSLTSGSGTNDFQMTAKGQINL